MVICPRITDASLVVGPAAWHHGWSPTDWDRLAGAVVAGHVIECGPQATGGNYAFFTEVAGVEHPGFPLAEVAEDGSSVITKHPGIGGEVSVGTVTAQLLYEIAGHHYPNTDVVARFDTFSVEQAGPDRVRIAGTRGLPAPEEVKVCLNLLGGWRNSMTFVLTGLDIEEKAALTLRSLADEPGRPRPVRRVRRPPDPIRQGGRAPQRGGHRPAAHHGQGRRPRGGRTTLLRGGHRVGPGRIPGPPPDRAAHRRRGLRGVLAGADARRPGGPRGDPRRRAPGAGAPHRLSGRRRPAARPDETARARQRTAADPEATGPGAGPIRRLPLGTLIGARSGDKGGNANVGLWARSDPAWQWLDGYLTIERFRALLPEADGLEVQRHAFANLRALNFVVVGLLGEGVASSTRPDPQAKGLGEYLRSRVVDIPVGLVADRPEE